MKKLIQDLIRKKNSKFEFDNDVSIRIIISLAIHMGASLIRGVCKLLLNFKSPKIIFIEHSVRLLYSNNIVFGRWIKIAHGVTLSGLGKGKLEIGDGSSIGAYSQIIVSTSFNNIGKFIHIGKNVGIGQFASLGGSGGLQIGDNCIIGQYFSCHPENHNFEKLDVLIKDQGTTRGEITIRENCWIGSKVTILAGVTIGCNCVIAAGSVVTKDMPSNCVIGGVPAKIIKIRD